MTQGESETRSTWPAGARGRLVNQAGIIYIFLGLLIAFGAYAQDLNNDLIQAAKDGHTAKVEALLKAGADVNAKNARDETVLMWAAGEGHLEIVQALLSAGAAINKRDDGGWTALMLGAKEDKVDVAQVLIAAGADVNARSKDGWTPLLIAANYHRSAVLENLLEEGADVNATVDGKTAQELTPLILEAMGGNTRSVQALLAHGAEVDATDGEGRTALIWALKEQKHDTALELMRRGADPTPKANDGSTAVMWLSTIDLDPHFNWLIVDGEGVHSLPCRLRNIDLCITPGEHTIKFSYTAYFVSPDVFEREYEGAAKIKVVAGHSYTLNFHHGAGGNVHLYDQGTIVAAGSEATKPVLAAMESTSPEVRELATKDLEEIKRTEVRSTRGEKHSFMALETLFETPASSGRIANCSTFNAHSGTVLSVAFSPDGTLLVTGSEDDTIKLWSLPGGKLQRTLYSSVTSVAFQPDGTLLASGTYSGTVKLWSLPRAELSKAFQGQETSHSVTSVAFSPDGTLLASGDNGGTVKLWSLADRKLKKVFPGTLEHPLGGALAGSWRVTCVAFSPDGTLLATGSEYWTSSGNTAGYIKLWSLPEGELQESLSSKVTSLAFSADGALLASGRYAERGFSRRPSQRDAVIKFWSLRHGKQQKRSRNRGLSRKSVGGDVLSLAFSPDGTLLASGSTDGTITLWPHPYGGHQETHQEDSDDIVSVAFSPDGTLLASGDEGGKVTMCSVFRTRP